MLLFDAITKIRKYGNHKDEFRLGTGFVMANGNELEVYDFCKKVKDLGADNVRLGLTFSDKHLDYFEDKTLLKKGILLAKQAVDDFSDNSFKVINLIQERGRNLYECTNDYSPCHTKDVLCVLEGEGNVYTCCTFTGSNKGILGNIHKNPDGFKGVWRDSFEFRKNLNPRNYCNVSCLYNPEKSGDD